MTCDKEFLDIIPKVHSKKEIMINQSSIRFKIFVLQKLWREQKDKLQNQRKIFANCISNNGFISRLFKEFSKCNYKKRNNPI